MTFTTGDAFEYDPPLYGDVLRRVQEAFRNNQPVAVLNADASRWLFQRREAVGQQIVVAGQVFQVAAVRPIVRQIPWNEAFVPLSYYQKLQPRVWRMAGNNFTSLLPNHRGARAGPPG